MRIGVLRDRRRLAQAVGAVLGLLSLEVAAQLAPVSGAHYAGRASDTGYTGAATPGGGYGASVPLDFSPFDPVLPIPLQVAYGGRRVGAAGLGWDVPLSYVVHETTAAHRRPENGIGGPKGHEQWALMLFGERIDLVRNPADTAWIAQRAHPQLEVRATGPDVLTVYDGDGRAYVFDSRRNDGTHLAGGNLFLLTGVSDAAGRQVKLDYSTPDVTLDSGGKGLEIDLARISYNAHPTAPDCFKGAAALHYAPAGKVLSMSTLGSTVLARASTLSDVTITSTETCAGTPTTLRKYAFDYADPVTRVARPDPDTALPRLQAVIMTGREGTPEATVKLPIAAYGYGSIVDASTGKISFEKAQSVAPIPHAGAHTFDYGIAYTSTGASTTPHNEGDVVWTLTTEQNLVDLNGDGRADFRDETGFYHNQPDLNGVSLFVPGGRSGAPVDDREVIESLTFKAANNPAGAAQISGINDTLRQLVDMNGDGRLDVVETGNADTNHWTIHLNTPDAANPKKIVWVDVSIPVTRMRTALNSTGVTFDRVPLARRTTVPKFFAHCWFWAAENQRWQADSLSGCADIPPSATLPRTITEFQLRDVNGDGYPDFVYNASRVQTSDPVVKPPIPSNPAPLQRASTLLAPDMLGARDVKVLLNVAGTHLANGTDVFAAAPVTWEAGGATGCGIERWEPEGDLAGATNSAPIVELCGIEDVDGDGIADRVTSTAQGSGWSTKAVLGTGDIAAPLAAAATIALPATLGRTQTLVTSVPSGGWQTPCGSGNVAFSDTHRTRGLRDLNGDGIPDFIDGSTVAIGTGTGYTAPIAIATPIALELSLERTACQSLIKSTPTGLYDIDGDGQPELVTLVAAGQGPGSPKWDVYQLKRGAPQVDVGTAYSIPEAGRLTRVDNGYGAVTRIGYQSAKNDIYSTHQVPFPEVVATAVATVDAVTGLQVAATTHYAYGRSALYFDPMADSFVSAGYGRSAVVTPSFGAPSTQAVATITDTYGPGAFSPGQDATARYRRYARVGLISDVTTLAGDAGPLQNPWNLLGVDTAYDARRIAGAHSDWEVRLLPAGTKAAFNATCIDMMHPYDYAASVADALSANDDFCTKNGFTFQTTSIAWRGAPNGNPLPALASTVVAVNNEVKPGDVDDFGRVKAVGVYNDLNRADDDLCVQTTYANPPTAATRPRVLNAPAQRVVRTCTAANTVLAKDVWEYDTVGGVKLPAGQVTKGNLTAHVVSRLDENGQPIPDATGSAELRQFDATVDARGNPVSVVSPRDDGATRTLSATYDAFGLVPMTSTLSATNADQTTLPTLASTLERDPLTLSVVGVTNPNGSQAGMTFDGFGRELSTTVMPASGAAGVMSTANYLGYAVGESGGRRIVRTRYADPVAASSVGTAPGRRRTTFFDPLGRVQRSEVSLGVDYGNQVLTVGQRVYDAQGRVAFVADAYTTGESFPTAYGTTNFYNTDGTLKCSVRAFGQQASRSNWVTEESAAQIYPTCYSRTFQDYAQIDAVQGPDALAAYSAQKGVSTRTTRSATGRLLAQRVVGPAGVLEHTAYASDALGRIVLRRRYKAPGMLEQPVDTAWHYDSLGAMTRLDEQGNAPQLRRFDRWGAVTREQHCDDGSIAPCAANDRRTVFRYDAYGRLTHSEQRSGGSTDTDGTLDVDTVNDYTYDLPATFVNRLAPTFVLGRLASANSSTLQVSLSYDAYGRVNGRGYNDRHGNTNVEKHTFHADGSEQVLDLLVNDAGFKDEQVAYAYDSAGRPRAVTYSDGTSVQSLYAAGANGIDAYGRLVQAQYDATVLSAAYEPAGRRMPVSLQLSTPAAIRQIAFPPQGGLPAFDPAGRERARIETIGGTTRSVLWSYDAQGRLADAVRGVADPAMPNFTYTYDPLGNLLTQDNLTQPDFPNRLTATYAASGDLDRLCSIAYGPTTPPPSCNVVHDGAGNVVSEPSPTGVRTLSWYPDGHVKQIKANGADATFKYDAFGSLQALQLTGGTSPDTRADRHFGALLSLRNEKVGGTIKSVMTRTIPLPGATATRHGATGPWSYTFGEDRGSRFVTDGAVFVQDIDYQPYGVANSTTPTGTGKPGLPLYENEQWNGGDALTALGLVQVGARLYDPRIGRFLSRDPVFDPGNANPYAFASNDPVNGFDPTGMTEGISRDGVGILIRREGNMGSYGALGAMGASALGGAASGAGGSGPAGDGNGSSAAVEAPQPLSPLPGGFIGPGEIERGDGRSGDGPAGAGGTSSGAGGPSSDRFLLGEQSPGHGGTGRGSGAPAHQGGQVSLGSPDNEVLRKMAWMAAFHSCVASGHPCGPEKLALDAAVLSAFVTWARGWEGRTGKVLKAAGSDVIDLDDAIERLSDSNKRHLSNRDLIEMFATGKWPFSYLGAPELTALRAIAGAEDLAHRYDESFLHQAEYLRLEGDAAWSSIGGYALGDWYGPELGPLMRALRTD